MITPEQLLAKYPIISPQVGQGELRVILRELHKIIQQDIPGDIVEFGCFIGTSSLFIRRLLDSYQQASRAFHVYDSFAGLPEKTAQDASPLGADFKAGELSISKKEFLRQFRAANLNPPIVHKGWFAELSDQDVPRHIAFAFLDGDFYQSVLTSLKLVWPHMSPGGVILVDDYNREALPGAEKAVHEFLQHKQYKTLRAEHQIAIIQL